MNDDVYKQLLDECKRDLADLNEVIEHEKKHCKYGHYGGYDRRYLALISEREDLIYKIRLLTKKVKKEGNNHEHTKNT